MDTEAVLNDDTFVRTRWSNGENIIEFWYQREFDDGDFVYLHKTDDTFTLISVCWSKPIVITNDFIWTYSHDMSPNKYEFETVDDIVTTLFPRIEKWLNTIDTH